jgi:hypothetical protein
LTTRNPCDPAALPPVPLALWVRPGAVEARVITLVLAKVLVLAKLIPGLSLLLAAGACRPLEAGGATALA